ncbi:MAG TPA: hypothetical protein VHM02_11930 [Thermoanaerobaculia bacterium]|nr:hypothetical protein [Thermoanaerobaculia bacterium]
MSEPARSIDFVATLREVRDRLNAEIADLGYEELVARLRKRTSTDPLLERLATSGRRTDALEPDDQDR